MTLDERAPIQYVNGGTFAMGFAAFLVVFTAVMIVGWLIRRHQEEVEHDGVDNHIQNQDDYFQKIEDFRNDFR